MSKLVPTGWNRLPLKDYVYFQEGPGLRNWQYSNCGIPFLNIRCIVNKTLDLSNAQYISVEEAEKKYKHFLLDEDDLVLSTSGTIGRYALIKKHHLPLMLNTSIIRFRSRNEDKICKQFLEYYLQSSDFLTQLLVESQGSAQVNVGPTHLQKVNSLLPPLPEQQKIASILTSVDTVIEKTEAQINKLKDLKKAMMQELLTKGIGHTEFKDSPVGRIPRSWEVVNFDSITSSYAYGPRFSANNYSSDGNVKTIRGTDVSELGEIIYTQVPIANIENETVERHKLKNGDLVMITTADCGLTAVFEEQEIPFICSAYAIRFRLKNSITPKYLKYFMQTDFSRSEVESFVRKGTVANLPGSDVLKIRFPMPNLEEQNNIVSILESIELEEKCKELKLSHTKSLKKALMQDLLTGKVRVKV
jgi:type I restriction enzyme, S subunit